MASDAAVSAVLALLQELYPTREVSPAALDAWSLVFADWDDAEFRTCALRCARQPGRTFFPTPGEIAGCRAVPPVDVDAILSRISKLGAYHPASGWLYPRPETVRAALGDAIADAYGAAGGAALFAEAASDGSTITRDIARRVFAKDVEETQREQPGRPLLAAPPDVRRLAVDALVKGVVAARTFPIA